jgi:hypothetical protein
MALYCSRCQGQPLNSHQPEGLLAKFNYPPWEMWGKGLGGVWWGWGLIQIEIYFVLIIATLK